MTRKIAIRRDSCYNADVSDKKLCPKCKNVAPIAAQTCLTCGHIFRTQFLDRTQMIQSAPAEIIPPNPTPAQYIPPPGQPQFDHHQAQNISQGISDAGKGIKWTPWAIIIGAFIIASPCLGCYGLALAASCMPPRTANNDLSSPKAGSHAQSIASQIHVGMSVRAVEEITGGHENEFIGNPLADGSVNAIRVYDFDDGAVSVAYRTDSWTVIEPGIATGL